MGNLYRNDIADVDISKPILRTNPGVLLASDDNLANRFGANILLNGQPVDISKGKVTGYFIRPNGDTVFIEGKANGNTAHVDLPQECYAVNGSFSLAIKVAMEGTTMTARVIDGHIRQTRTDAVVDPGEVLPSLEELLAHIEEMEQATNAANEAANNANFVASNVMNQVLFRAPAIINEASGDVVTISDATAQHAYSLVSHIEPVQEGSGDPSPDNVRPIRGWDSAKAQRTGKNLLKYPHVDRTTTTDGITFTDNGDGTITANGTATDTATYVCATDSLTNGLYLKPGIYTLSGCPAGGGYTTWYIRAVANTNGLQADDTGSSATGTVLKAASCTGVLIRIAKGVTVKNLLFCPQIERGAVATAYEPYQGQTLTATLPETVYGGTLNWTTGVLTVSRKKQVIDSSNYNTKSSANGFVLMDSSACTGAKSNTLVVCDRFPSKLYDGNYKGYVAIHTAGRLFIGIPFDLVGITSDSSQTECKQLINQWLSANPLTVVYELETPYTIRLTPQQLAMLYGTNNVWSSTGDTSLVYFADTKQYIDNKLSELTAAVLSTGANV